MNAAPASEWRESWLTPGRFALGLAAVLTALFFPVLLGGESFYFRDFGIFGYPLAHYHRESFYAGEWPLWNPYNYCGLPFLAQWNTLALYPGSAIYLLLPLPWSLNVFCVGHLFWAGLGAYVLAGEWTRNRWAGAVAGVGFALNGLLLCSLKWPNNIAVMGWMPWVIWLVERAWRRGGVAVPLAALAGAAQMFAGTPELILLTWFFLLALALGQAIRGGLDRRALARRLVAVVLLVAGLAAAQLLPFLELLAQSHRSSGFGAATWAMPWWGWANFLSPLFWGFPSHQGVFVQYGQYWIGSYYIGLPVTLLAVWAAWRLRNGRAWLLVAVGGAGLWLALGDAGGLYRLAVALCPPLGFMRFPIKFVVWPVLAAPLLAALGLARLESLPTGDRRPAARALAVLGGGALAGMGLLLAVAWAWPMPADDWAATARNSALRAGLLVLAGGLWWTRWRTSGPRRRQVLAVAFLGVAVADVVTHAPWQNPTVPRWALQPGLAELHPPPALGDARAMLTPAALARLDHWAPSEPVQDYLASRLGLFCNCNLLEGVPKLDGFYSLLLPSTEEVLGQVSEGSGRARPGLAAFLGVAQETAPGKMASWIARPGAQPLIQAGLEPRFLDLADTLRLLGSSSFQPQGMVCLPPSARDPTGVTNRARARVLWQRWSRHRLEFGVEAREAAWVAISQASYPCWQATVDGQPVALWPANLAFQGLAVPAGRHQVSLEYVDRWFRWGAVLSLVCLAVCALFAWRSRAPPVCSRQIGD